LTQPTQALTDLLLGVVVLGLALRLARMPAGHGYWRAAFGWAAAAALCGFVHHGILARWPTVRAISWATISVMVVLAVSYLLAATIAEVLGPGHARTFWAVRAVGVLAYIALAATGHAGIGAILTCESITMTGVLALWGWAAYRQHPLAVPVLIAMLASVAAGGTKALSPNITGLVHLDPTSTYHLAQIAGMVLLYHAVTVVPRRQPVRAETRGQLAH
jgi:uncharacterized protein DUF6962